MSMMSQANTVLNCPIPIFVNLFTLNDKYNSAGLLLWHIYMVID